MLKRLENVQSLLCELSEKLFYAEKPVLHPEVILGQLEEIVTTGLILEERLTRYIYDEIDEEAQVFSLRISTLSRQKADSLNSYELMVQLISLQNTLDNLISLFETVEADIQ